MADWIYCGGPQAYTGYSPVAAIVPTITTVASTVNFFGVGSARLDGICDEHKQVILLRRAATAGGLAAATPLNPSIYVAYNARAWSIASVPIVAGANYFSASAWLDGTESAQSSSVLITGVDCMASPLSLGSAESLLYNALQSMLVGGVTGIDTVLYKGQEKKVCPCIVCEILPRQRMMVTSAWIIYRITMQVQVWVKDFYAPVDGRFDDTNLGDTKKGSAAYAEAAKNRILTQWTTYLSGYVDEMLPTRVEEIVQQGEVVGHTLVFEMIYKEARVA